MQILMYFGENFMDDFTGFLGNLKKLQYKFLDSRTKIREFN